MESNWPIAVFADPIAFAVVCAVPEIGSTFDMFCSAVGIWRNP